MLNRIKQERKDKAGDMRSREEIYEEVYPRYRIADAEDWERDKAKLEVLLDIRELLAVLVTTNAS